MKTLYVHKFSVASEVDILEAARAILADRAGGSQSVLDLDSGPYTRLRHHLRDYKRSVFGAIFIDARSRVVAVENIFFGTLGAGKINILKLIQSTLRHSAKSVIFFHYHVPSAPQPTIEDLQLARTLAAALSEINVDVTDLWILDDNGWQSLEESGLKL